MFAPCTEIAGDNNFGANMTIQDFELELKKISPDLSIRPNNPPQRVVEMFPDTVKLASILYQGVEVCSIPNYEIFDEKSGSYGIDIRGDGRFIAHRTRPEALQKVKETLEAIKNDKQYANDFFGRESSSDTELAKVDPPTPEIVDEVTAEVKPVQGGMIEEAK